MLKKIFKAIVLLAILGFGVNLYAAEISPEDSVYLKKTAEGLKKENVSLKAELMKLKDYNTVLKTKAEEFYIKNQDLRQAKDDTKSLGSMVEYLNKDRQALKKMNEQLRQDMTALEENTRREKAASYEELGTVCIQAKLYDLSIDAYEKSIKLNPNNAEVCYNLGLLYKYSQNDKKKAVYNFKKYLQLNPKAKNKEEVKYFIEMIQESHNQVIK